MKEIIIRSKYQINKWRRKNVVCSKCSNKINISEGSKIYSSGRGKNIYYYCSECVALIYMDFPDEE